jgi:hypothetical protein
LNNPRRRNTAMPTKMLQFTPATLAPLVVLFVSALAPQAHGADAPPKGAAKQTAPQKALTPAERADRAKGLALGQETAQRVSETQLLIADRVLTGEAACEFNQSVSLVAIDGQPGHFRLSFKKVNYTMVPEETSTGAVRLEDKKAGIVWLQIPSKSMLMNAKVGQRMVDGCQHAEQRAATRAVEAAGATKP